MHEIKKMTLDFCGEKTHALAFLPKGHVTSQTAGIFCHGYTSHKASLLNWASRMMEENVPCVIFDLPGHYLGNFSEVRNFEDFTSYAHKLFFKSHQKLLNLLGHKPKKIILGGHSLGGLLALKASKLQEFEAFEKIIFGVGLGTPPKDVTHVFESPFYKSTLKLRSSLVSAELSPEKVFPWIKEEKIHLKLSGKKIFLLSGLDDLVVGNDGMERFSKIFEDENQVDIQKVKRLPHHQPELAAAHIKKYLKDNGFI